MADSTTAGVRQGRRPFASWLQRLNDVPGYDNPPRARRDGLSFLRLMRGILFPCA
jgi:hypothetical protein